MKPLIAGALLLALAACGGTGTADPCQAITELEALDERFRSGDIATALEDRDRDALTTALGAAGDDAAALRDALEEGNADTTLIESAGLFARAANLADATFSAETIREDDLDAAFGYLDDARTKLRDAKSAAECG